MLLYCRKNTESENPQFTKKNKGRTIFYQSFICNRKRSQDL